MHSFEKIKGIGEIFHDQTKGFKFVCDSLHDYNILAFYIFRNHIVQHFTYCSKLLNEHNDDEHISI